MKNKSIAILIILISVLVAIGLICDFLIQSGDIKKCIFVSENYIFYVFSLIFTVATLGITLLSIIVSASNSKVLGVTLREIVALNNSPLKLNIMIVVALSMIFVSIPLLAFNCCTAITMLASCLIGFIGYNSVILSKFVFCNDYSKKIIRESLQNNHNIKPEYINYWLTELSTSITNNDITAEEEYLNLLRNAAEAHEKTNIENKLQYHNQLGKHIPRLFAESYKYQSFIDSYKRIIRLNDPKRVFFDERTIVYEIIMELKYATSRELHNKHIQALIADIIHCSFLEEEKVRICCWLLKSVDENTIVNKADRLGVIYEGFSQILIFNDYYDPIKVRIALIVFKHRILLANNFDNGRKIYSQFLKAIYIWNQYSSSESLISLLAQVIRAIYFWSFLETNMLTEERKKYIQSLPVCIVDTNDNNKLDISRLIMRYRMDIIKFLMRDALNDNWLDILEYESEMNSIKTCVYSPESKMRFALWFYSIWGVDFNKFPINSILSDINIKAKAIKYLFGVAISEFDDNKKLKESAFEHIKDLQELFNNNYLLPDHMIEASYDALNDQIKKINDTFITIESDKTVILDITNSLKNALEKEPELKLDKTLDIDSNTPCKSLTLLCSTDTEKNFGINRDFELFIYNELNNLIASELNVLKLKYDLASVNALKNKLKSDHFKICNYKYYTDFGFSTETKESEDYKELIDLIDSLDMKKYPRLTPRLFLTVDDIRYNYSIDNCSLETPKGEDLDYYLSPYRVANEQYNIDGGVYNKVSAIEYFRMTKRILRLKFRMITNINRNSGFRIIFDYDFPLD